MNKVNTKLSVNINKIATLRNARGGNTPNVVEAAINCERFGAQGITVHPRPDERHITYKDVYDLKKVITTEFNIEGNPIPSFKKLVLDVKPHQVTLVPDAEDAITSNAGWDTEKHLEYLKDVIAEFKAAGIRTSIFLDPRPELIESAAATGTDRIELYTEAFATDYSKGDEGAADLYKATAIFAEEAGLKVNAGHDLSLENIEFFIKELPNTAEVSIGHALISEALYFGLENTIQMYLRNRNRIFKSTRVMSRQIVFSKVMGESPRHLIIVHGLFGMLDNWATLGKKYAEYFTTHLIDLRNHGRSFHSEEISHTLMAEDLYYYMQEKGIEKASFIGHSLGGKVVMEFALKYPEKTEKLIVADMSPKDYEPHHQSVLKAINSVDFSQVKKRTDVEEFLKPYIKDASVRMFLMKSVHRLEDGKYTFKFNVKSLTENYEDLIKNYLPEKTFNGEVLFIGGGNSNYITKLDEPQIRHYFPKAEILTIEGAGHWLHAEKPSVFFDETFKFLK